MPITQVVEQAAREAGFELCGIAPVGELAELKFFSAWIEAGRAGEMKYLEARDEAGQLKRAALENAAPWARSVIVCAINYNTAEPYSTEVHDPDRGWISRYAWSREDYHDAVMRRLRIVEARLQEAVEGASSGAEAPKNARADGTAEAAPFQSGTGRGGGTQELPASVQAGAPKNLHASAEERRFSAASRQEKARGLRPPQNLQPLGNNDELITRCYVDTGPLVERVYAKYASVGWIGKNTCIINQKIGSWIFLGVILTSLDIAPPEFAEPERAAPETAKADELALQFTGSLPAPDRCGTCTRCIEACPTDAIVAPYQLDANLCIAYLTIEKRGEIPEAMRTGIGRHVFGCDICQDVCPWNRKAPATKVPEFQPREGLVNPALAWLAEISAEEFRETFRSSPLKRTKRTGVRRNAVIAMGNSGREEFVPLLEKLCADEDAVVAESARWAMRHCISRDDETQVSRKERGEPGAPT